MATNLFTWKLGGGHVTTLAGKAVRGGATLSASPAHFPDPMSSTPEPFNSESDNSAAAVGPLRVPEIEADVFPVTPRQSRLQDAIRLLSRNITNAFRLAFFLRVPENRMPVMWWQVVAFTVLSVAVPMLWSLWETNFGGEFHAQALQGMLFHVPLLICAGVTIAYAARQPEKSLAAVQMLLMIAVAVDVLCLAASLIWGGSGGAASRVMYRIVGRAAPYLPAIWLACASLVAIVRLLGIAPRARLPALLIATFIIALPLAMTFRDRSMWSESYEDRKAEAESYLRNNLTQEDIFYRQPELLARELAALQPQRPGVTDVFFIGMAGHGYQDVFKKEVDAVTELMRERFDATGHTIRLINNRQTVATTPIASVTSLTASLKRTAEVMDVEEDILVLFLTSHGSEAHRFSLDLYPLQFKELDPPALRKALDDSGIKYRVVVISACYSGGFIDALKDENTLVITAAAPDRNSFGCSNENDWTYFGKAYFDEALRKTTSFTDAFALAKPVIEAREKKDDYTPSDPRIAEGAGIKVKLAALQAQLSGAGRIAPAASPSAPIVDAASRYAELVYDQKFFEVERAACLASAQNTGPDAMVARKADTFAGLTPAHATWPQLTVAWDRYAEEMCKRFSEPALRRESFARHLRASSNPTEIESMIKFYATPRGEKWHAAEKRAMQLMLDDVAKRQDALQMSLYAAYVETQDRVYKAYGEAEGRKKRRVTSPGVPVSGFRSN